MEKIKVIALKSFEYEREIKTPQSLPFEVNKFDFTHFESLKMVKKVEEKPDQQEEKPKKKGK